MTTEDTLTDEQAEAMLARLSKHFNKPVMPIDRYCDGLRTWQRCMRERADKLREKLFPGLRSEAREEQQKAWAEYNEVKKRKNERSSEEETDRYYDLQDLWRYESTCEQIDYVFLQIQKSSLLARLLYDGQPLRTEPCPKHQGTWSGIGPCRHGCGSVGWLPTEAMLAKTTKEEWEATIVNNEKWLAMSKEKMSSFDEELALEVEWMKSELKKRFG